MSQPALCADEALATTGIARSGGEGRAPGLALPALLLVVLLVSLSAYLRLAHSGIGCDGWPACYGRIGAPAAAAPAPDATAAYERMGSADTLAHPGATLLHRLVASVLGVVVLALNVSAFRRRRFRAIAVALLALTVFLATIGLKSGSLHSPAVVMGNLAGGFAMLALLGWMVFSSGARAPSTGRRGPRTLAVVGLALLGSQILLGGLTSANFAATACRSLPDCHGSWLPGPALKGAFDLARQHQVTAEGTAIGGEERAAIHKTHRLGAVVALLVILAAGAAAVRAGPRWRSAGLVVLALVLAEFAVGALSVLASLPIVLAVAHNWLAAMLLLALLKLVALTTGKVRS